MDKLKQDIIQASMKNKLVINTAGFLLMVTLIIIRYPNFILQPRFWAEEAIYFEIFYSLDSWWHAFDLLIYPAYYLFLSRLGPSLATLFPIEYAPLITSLLGLLILSIPLIIIFFTDSHYWKSTKNKIVISLLYIVCSTTGEVWMTSTNLGFIVPVFVFLILIDDNLHSFAKRIFYNFLLFIGSISSPIAMIMAPFFFIKHFLKRNAYSKNYCIILFIAALFQLIHYLTASNFGMVAEDRLVIGSWDMPTIFGNLLAYNFIFPLFGYFISLLFREFFSLFAIGSNIESFLLSVNINSDPSSTFFIFFEFLAFAALPILCIFIIVTGLIVYKIFRRESIQKKFFFIGIYLYLSLALNFLSLGALGGFRYSIITSFILLFYLFTLLIDSPNQKNYLIKSLLTISLFIGFAEYYPRVHTYVPNTFVAEEIEWPKWTNEIELWESNASYLPRVWPYIKNKDLMYPERKKNEANIVCIDLNHPKNWERMGYRYFSASFLEMIQIGLEDRTDLQIIHYDNCYGNIIINGEQESLKQ